MEEDPHRYDDIIGLPHHQSARRPHMSLHDRAAQFAPFAALTGYEDMVEEEARLTDRKPELSEEEKEILSQKMNLVEDAIADGRGQRVTVTHYVADGRKSGGRLEEYTGEVRQIDPVFRRFVFFAENGVSAGKEIEIDNITDIRGGDTEAAAEEDFSQ